MKEDLAKTYCEIQILHHNGAVLKMGAYGLRQAKKKCREFFEACDTWPAFRIDTVKGYYCGIVEWSNQIEWLGWGQYQVMTTYEFFNIWKNTNLETAIVNAKNSKFFGNDTDIETIEHLMEIYASAVRRGKRYPPGTIAVEVISGAESETIAYGLRTDAQAKAAAETARRGFKYEGNDYEFAISEEFNDPYLLTEENPIGKGKMKWLKR